LAERVTLLALFSAIRSKASISAILIIFIAPLAGRVRVVGIAGIIFSLHLKLIIKEAIIWERQENVYIDFLSILLMVRKIVDCDVVECESGKKALELFLGNYEEPFERIRSAVESGDPKLLETTSHTFKGMAANITTEEPFLRAQELVTMAREGDLENSQATFDAFAQNIAILVEEIRAWLNHVE